MFTATDSSTTRSATARRLYTVTQEAFGDATGGQVLATDSLDDAAAFARTLGFGTCITYQGARCEKRRFVAYVAQDGTVRPVHGAPQPVVDYCAG